MSPLAFAQESPTTQLLSKAHALELRGRMDMAKQTWAQVLLADPNNTEALAGMARAAKSQGKIDEANQYLAQLRSINPSDPNIARVENMGTARDTNVLLKQAGELSQQGQYSRAMAILKQVYGNQPPPGDAALSYYQTEAATEDTRPQAVAGLRALVDKYPDDPRYAIALGKILTYNPRTRAEGRKLLSRYPNDADASESLRQALSWDQSNPANATEIRRFVQQHPDASLSNALAQDDQAMAARRRQQASVRAMTPEQKAALAAQAEQGREMQGAYAALNSKRYSEAEQRFQAVLERDPNNEKALAGLGYIRMNQANFGGAISYFTQAESAGDHSAGLEKALADSRFYYTLREASGALAEDDLPTAVSQFQSALAMRPNDASALQGLGGTLLKAEQPEPAISIYQTYTRLHGSDPQGWKGLFMAYSSANQFDLALGVDRRMPSGIHARLMRDPDYLRTLASVYSATNHDLEAQRILQTALSLPFPTDARGLRADVQMQYAALLSAAGRQEQASALYREVLAADSNNTTAWVGLVQADHGMGNDVDAYAQLQQMPPTNYQAAMQEPGFATSVASIYISQGHDDLAQNVLEQFLTAQQQNGQKPFVAAQVTLANLYLKHNNTEKAFPLFEQILTNNPDRPDAWKGLLNSLHATGHDQEALAEIQQMSPEMRRQLEADPDYLQTVGNIYAALGHPQDAMRFLNRAQAHYKQMGMTTPSAMDIQASWLLFNIGNDPALFKQLMMLGGRRDLTDAQRRQVQTLWASWAVRRSQQALAARNPKRAIALLNAAARAFPNNPGVLKALGSGYAAAGLPKEAIQIFRAQDLSTGDAADYRAAVGAALSGNDLKDAELWLRFGLDQYPRDAQLLGLAAKFETARGNAGRAADYYRASLTAMPGPDPGEQLAEALSHAPAPTRLPSQEAPQDLAALLSQPDAPVSSRATVVEDRPYLPGYGNMGAQAPVIVNQVPSRSYTSGASRPSKRYETAVPNSAASGYSYPSTTTIVQPSYQSQTGGYSYTTPASPAAESYVPSTQSAPASSPTYYGGSSYDGSGGVSVPAPVKPLKRRSTLGDYVPQSSLVERALPGQVRQEAQVSVLHLKPSAGRSYPLFIPGEPLPDAKGEAELVATVFQDRPQTLAVVKPTGGRQEDSTVRFTDGMAASSTPTMVTASAIMQQVTAADGTPLVQYVPVSVVESSGQQDNSQKSSTYTNPFANLGVPQQSKPATHPIRLRSHNWTGTARRNEGTGASSQPHYVPPPVYVPSDSPSSYVSHSPDRTIRLAPPITAQSATTPRTSRMTSAAARQRAAAIRANQAQSPLLLQGVSHPPSENYTTDNDSSTGLIKNAQFNAAAPQGNQISQPKPQAGQSSDRNTFSNFSSQGSSSSIDGQQGVGYSQQPTPGQQYPQPRTRGTTSSGTRRRSTRSSRTATTPQTLPPVQQTSPMAYPVYPQPLQNEGTPETQSTYPLPQAPTDDDLRQQNVPPLRGYFDPRVSANPKQPLTERQQTQLDLALIEASYSSWMGGSAYAWYRSGTAGIDRLTGLAAPFEVSFALGKAARLSFVPKAVFLNTGVLVQSADPVGKPILGTLYDSQTPSTVQQFASGVGGEVQFSTATFNAALGYSPYGFPVSNMIGRASWKPGNWHFTFYGGRDSIKETMLSYAGMRDPNPNSNGDIWGGVVGTGGGIRFDAGDAKSGLYVQGEGAQLTGYHVLTNRKYDGTMGAYFRVANWAEYGSLNIGGTIFGEHFDYNERGYTYGLGGYFSPNAYFLAAVPITWSGHWKENLHYTINGAIGLQTFQEDSQLYFPLDAAAQSQVPTVAGSGLTVNSNTGANYGLDAQVSYHVNEHWYIGGFMSANNTNNYNYVSGGAFARFTFKPQVQTVEYPTGLFPVEGFRPLRIP
ncbi:MAG: cellulose synthase subunit BcsC-related outer membrane protein [Acidobacteriaceae bacterium]|nr:cellulose synthase subunit BcsC-related outer membrane protein [Acidobacteriaceae bacterium]